MNQEPTRECCRNGILMYNENGEAIFPAKIICTKCSPYPSTRECCEEKHQFKVTRVGLKIGVSHPVIACDCKCHSIKPHPLTELLNNKEKMLEIGRKASEDQQEVIDSIKPPECEHQNIGKEITAPYNLVCNDCLEVLNQPELSPELSWEDTLREIVYKNWKNGDEVGLYEEIKSFIKSQKEKSYELGKKVKAEHIKFEALTHFKEVLTRNLDKHCIYEVGVESLLDGLTKE